MAYQLGVTLDDIHAMSFNEYHGWNKYFQDIDTSKLDFHRIGS